jgi:DMSO/TMAO reductase YedYZ molybdopterin-dependent catalytic subunit
MDKKRHERAIKTEPQTLSRRTVLEWLGAAGALTLVGAAGACSDGAAALPPGADARTADGGPNDAAAVEARVWPDGPGGDASSYPYAPGDGKHPVFSGWGERTVDPQEIKTILASWKLTVDGMVGSPKVYSFADLVDLGVQDQQTDFHCVEGWSVLDVPWNGVHISKIFDEVKPATKATYVSFHTINSKYNESVPLSIAKEPRTLLGLGVGGYTLPLKHGFPLRIVIPRLLGYKNPKFVDRIELTDKPLHGFWVKAGYGYDGDVPAARLRPGKY